MNSENENIETKQGNISRIIPNFVTVLALCSGLTSIRYSIIEEWKLAAFLIILAAVLDFFDGWFAKKLKVGSQFGAELDNLNDIISFGVAPSILVYFWSTKYLNSLGWAVTLFFVVCAALRLARFTTDIYLSNQPIDKQKYFIGIPSPAAAGLILLTLFAYFEFNLLFFKNPYLNILILFIVGLMMISKVPTFSLKNLSVNSTYVPSFILFFAIICIGLISNVWITLIICLIVYIASIFYTIIINFKKK